MGHYSLDPGKKFPVDQFREHGLVHKVLPFWGCPIVFDVHNCSNFNISHISYFALGKPFAFSSFLILIVDHLYTAIIERKKVTFQYFDYTPEKKKVHRHDGQLYTVSPYAMLWKTEYTRQAFENCVIKDGPVTVVPSEAAVKYHTIQEGVCEGTIIGGNLCTLNLLQGTPYMPDISDKVLFLEDDNIMGEYFCYEFDRNLESLLQVEGADTIKGIIFGRFDDSCGLTVETITDIIRDKVPSHIPVVFGADFGHVFPMITFPIGGSVRIRVNQDKVEIVIVAH